VLHVDVLGHFACHVCLYVLFPATSVVPEFTTVQYIMLHRQEFVLHVRRGTYPCRIRFTRPNKSYIYLAYYFCLLVTIQV
jgi:hypothetical protein